MKSLFYFGLIMVSLNLVPHARADSCSNEQLEANCFNVKKLPISEQDFPTIGCICQSDLDGFTGELVEVLTRGDAPSICGTRHQPACPPKPRGCPGMSMPCARGCCPIIH